MKPLTAKPLTALLGIAAFACSVSSAQAAEGPYVSFQAGGSFLSDADNVGAGLTIESSFDTGFGLAGAAGYSFKNGIRLEGEVSYRRISLDKLTITNDGGLGVALGVGSLDGLSLSADGNVSALGFMANAFYDFRLGNSVKPYVGGGVGLARLSINDVAVLGVTIVDDDDTVFAYQVSGGVGFEVTPATTIFLDYRYFATADPSFSDVLGGGFNSEYASHNVSVGLRYNF